MKKENSLAKDFVNLFSGNTKDTDNIESIEIIIKPKRSKSIKPIAQNIADRIPQDENTTKMTMRAKVESTSLLTDLYLVGQGAISDNLEKIDESKIPIVLEDKYTNNKLLKAKIQEYNSDETRKTKKVSIIDNFSVTDAWPNFISGLQMDDIMSPQSNHEPSVPEE